jgi:hypothetical protein
VTPPVNLRPTEGTLELVSPTELRIRLDRPAAGVLTIRNAYDAGWRATVDGRPADTLPVDAFLQGVSLPSDASEVVLTYHDDAVMLGLALGAAIWAVLLAAPFLALGTERRAAPRPAPRPTRSRPQPPVA